ncbi:MAG: hypothetical protein ABJG41_19865, partial [Cyclobacteriaceae bacterium]
VTDNSDPNNTCYADADQTITDDPATIIVTNVTETDADQCSPVNGAIQVDAITINGSTTNTAAGFQALEASGYTFDVLQSDAATLEKTFNIAADAVTFPGADNLAAGTYYVRVTNDLSCTSALFQFEVDDVKPVPTTNTISGINNTTCSGTPNGQVSTNFVWTGGTVSYEWYYGTIASGTAVGPLTDTQNLGNGSVVSIGGGTPEQVDGLAGGTYYVVISDTDGGIGTGCTFTQEITILDDAATVTITGPASGSDNTGCTAAFYDGSYTVTNATTDGAGTFPGDYEFEWYTNGGALLETTDGVPTKSDFDNGSYFVIAVDKTTNCSSSQQSFTINDNITPVVITNSVVTDVERCDATINNGSIDIEVDGFADPGAAYTIQWYTGGVGTIGAGTLIGSETDDLFDEQNTGTYSVRVTLDATGCFVDQQFTINSTPATTPTFTLNTTDASTCVPGDGQITVNTLSPGVAADYTWTWLQADKTTDVSAIAGSDLTTDGTADLIPDGDYYVVIEHNNTGCVSDTVSVTVDRNANSVISIAEANVVEPGDCDALVGEFDLELSDAAGTTQVDVTITDDFGNSVTLNNVSINGGVPEVSVAGVDPADGSVFVSSSKGVTANNPDIDFINGAYYIEVSNSDATGCTDTYDFFLPYQNAPRLDLAVPVVTNHSTNCQPYEGAAINPGDNRDGSTGGQGGATGSVDITLTILDGVINTDNHGNYQIFLYQGDAPTPSPDTFIALTLDDASGLSDMDVVTIGGSSAALFGNPIGNNIILEFIDGNISDFTTVSNVFDTGETINAVTKDGLWSVAQAARPTSIQVREGTDVAASGNDYIGTYSFDGLVAGEYTIMAAQEGAAFCLSPSVTFEIEDRFEELDIVNNTSHIDIFDDTNCDGGTTNSNGEINIKQIDRVLNDGAGSTLVDGTDAATDADYTFTWYVGSDISGTLLSAAGYGTIVGSGNQVTELPAGDYTVLIENGTSTIGSGDACSQTYTFEIISNQDDISIDAGGTTPTANANDNCDSPYDGSIAMSGVDIDIVDRTGATSDVTWPIAGYEAFLYESGSGQLAFNGTDNTQASDINYLSDATGTTFGQLQDGDYYIVIVNDLDCESSPYSITVSDNTLNPVVSAGTADTDNTQCIDNANGIITASLLGDAANYNITWYKGGVTSTDLFVDGTDGDISTTTGSTPSTLTLSNIKGGTYTVKVEDVTNSIGCVGYFTASISDNVDAITGFDFSKSDNMDCNPDNGSVTLTDIDLYNSSSNTTTNLTAGDETAMDEYTIRVYNSAGSSVLFTDTEDAGDNLTISGLSPGDYLLEIEHPTAMCTSAQKSFSIADDYTNPTVAITEDNQNTICDPALAGTDADGQLTATVTGDADDNYSFQWYAGADGNTST